MKERPILFSGPMVQAILAGWKTQTRRVVKGQLISLGRDIKPEHFDWFSSRNPQKLGLTLKELAAFCPHGQPGDRLWVKETFARVHDGLLMNLDPDPDSDGWHFIYRANGEDLATPAGMEGPPTHSIRSYGETWKPSIFCSRAASRITLEIVSVRVERLNEITRGDCMAEGCPFPNIAKETDPKKWYADLWESINGAGSWADNPWVWVIEFKRV